MKRMVLTGAEIRIAAVDSGVTTGADRAAATAVLFRVSWKCGAETRRKTGGVVWFVLRMEK